jgi:hypothetical protein
MTTQTVYQTDKDGWFVSVVEAEESPLEPGVFLIPAGCVEVAPQATVPTGSYPKWNGTAWVVTAINATPTPTVDPSMAIVATMQAQLIALQQQINTLQASVVTPLPVAPTVPTPATTEATTGGTTASTTDVTYTTAANAAAEAPTTPVDTTSTDTSTPADTTTDDTTTADTSSTTATK